MVEKLAGNVYAVIAARYVMPIMIAIIGWFLITTLSDIKAAQTASSTDISSIRTTQSSAATNISTLTVQVQANRERADDQATQLNQSINRLSTQVDGLKKP